MNLKFVVAIFAWLQSLPVSRYDTDEDYGARADRLWTVAEAVAESSRGNRRVAAFELVQANRESGFALDAQTCQCAPKRCDPVHGVPMAHSGWQLHRAPTQSVESWHAYCGTTRDAVLRAANRARAFLTWSGGDLSKAVVLMGGARASVEQRWVKVRVAEMLELEGRL